MNILLITTALAVYFTLGYMIGKDSGIKKGREQYRQIVEKQLQTLLKESQQ